MNHGNKISKITRRIGVWRFSAVELLVSLILFIVMTPFVEDIPNAAFLEPLLLTMVLVAGLLAVGGRRHVLWVGLVLLLPSVMFRWLHHLHPGLLSPAVFLGFGLVFIGFVVANILRFILRAARVDNEVICAGISVYLLIGMLWSLAYKLLGEVSPAAFVFRQRAGCRAEDDEFQCLLFQFLHPEFRWLRRHHAGLEGRPHACRHGGRHRHPLRGRADFAAGVLVFSARARVRQRIMKIHLFLSSPPWCFRLHPVCDGQGNQGHAARVSIPRRASRSSRWTATSARRKPPGGNSTRIRRTRRRWGTIISRLSRIMGTLRGSGLKPWAAPIQSRIPHACLETRSAAGMESREV